MNENQKIVIRWLSNTGQNYINDLVELEGGYDSVPDEVCNAFVELSYKEQLEVVQKSVSKVLLRKRKVTDQC